MNKDIKKEDKPAEKKEEVKKDDPKSKEEKKEDKDKPVQKKEVKLEDFNVYMKKGDYQVHILVEEVRELKGMDLEYINPNIAEK
jgi:hypothetical protein